MSTHFALRASVFAIVGICASALIIFWSIGTAHADSYNGFNLYPVEGFSSGSDSVWYWNAQSGIGSSDCDDDFDLDDSSCIMTPGYHGYGGGGYTQQRQHNNWWNNNNFWNSSIYFGNPLVW